MNIKQKSYWTRLTGDAVAFSMENRAFNLVSFISLIVLVYMFVADVIIGQWQMCIVLSVLFVAQSILYYRSLILKKYRVEIIVYGLACYAALAMNYHYNAGVGGPTFFVFFLIFLLILTISPMRYNKYWLGAQLLVPMGLVMIEYFYPDFVPNSYESRTQKYFDVLSTYLAITIFFYFVATYLKRYYKAEKRISDERHAAISAQNEFIRKQKEELEQLNTEKNKIFSIISHDLRSPVDSIKGYLEILSKGGISDGEKAEIEDMLLSQVQYTSDLMQNLLHWSKSQMKGGQVKLVPVFLADVLDDAADAKLTGAFTKGVKITYSLDKELEIIADVDMLKLVLRNLLGNAVKFTPPGGEVAIRAVKNGKWAEIAVKDNGIGISRAKQQELFSLNSGSTFGTNDEKGIGLGLILCKDFTERQGGRIWFDSEENKGSTFYIALRLASN